MATIEEAVEMRSKWEVEGSTGFSVMPVEHAPRILSTTLPI